MLKNVNLVRAERMLPEQRKELGLEITEGLVALETHEVNSKLKRVAVPIQNGILQYLHGLGPFKEVPI